MEAMDRNHPNVWGWENIDPLEAAAARTLPPVERTDYQDSISENEENKINEIGV